MDHVRSRRGYHSRTRLCTQVLAALATSWLLSLPAAAAADAATPEWQSVRAAVTEEVNRARAASGLVPLVPDALAQRVGDVFCALQAAQGGLGHVAADGVMPYLRYLLAGGTGFHRQNAGSYDSTRAIAAAEVEGIALGLTRDMLAEKPPGDGHRKTLLDPHATHIGVGLAVSGGRVRLSHEVVRQWLSDWRPAPVIARTRQVLRLAGRVQPPFRLVGVEVAWEALPEPLPEPVRVYGYPPERSITYDRGRSNEPLAIRGPRFQYHWRSGPQPGVEVVVLWASAHRGGRALEPIGATVAVVNETGEMPAHLAFWAGLRD